MTCSLRHLCFPLSRLLHLLFHWENKITWDFPLLSFTKPTHLHIFLPFFSCSFVTTEDMSLPKFKLYPLPVLCISFTRTSSGPFLCLTLAVFLLFVFDGYSTMATSSRVSTILKKKERQKKKNSLYLPSCSPHSQTSRFFFSASLLSTHSLTHCYLCPILNTPVEGFLPWAWWGY